MESPQSPQIPTEATTLNANMNVRVETIKSSVKIRRILPKPTSLNAVDTHAAFAHKIKQRQCHNTAQSLNYEVCLLNQSSIITDGDGPTDVKLFTCDKCPPTSKEPVKFRRFEDLSRHYNRIHKLKLLRRASVYCREENCSFKVSTLFFNFSHNCLNTLLIYSLGELKI